MPNDTLTKIGDTTNNHLANERTFLAWVRTSISIIVFGFVVARFGIALREFSLAQNHPIQQSNTSLEIGVGFMIVGTLIALISLFRYQVDMHQIAKGSFKPATVTTLLVGFFTTLFGLTLIIYLMMTAQSLG